MRDIYAYDNGVLRNKLGIRDKETLEAAEADYVVFKLKQLAKEPMPGAYDFTHLLNMHRFLFEDIYEWAGEWRKVHIIKEERVLAGLSIDYSDVIDIVRDGENVLKDMRKKPWNDMSEAEAAEQFSDSFGRLWRVHPFREGNTRTVVTFCCQYSDEVGLNLNRDLFEENAKYVRDALVAYNAVFADAGDLSQKEHLIRIVNDAIQRI